MTRLPALFLLCFATSWGCVPKNTEPNTVEEAKADTSYTFSNSTILRIDEFFESKFKRGVFSGTILILENDSVYTGSFGYSNFRKKEKLELGNKFQLASASKPITALAILRLVDQQKMSLDDSIQVYIPAFPYSGISIRMLLSHRSGLGNYMYITDSLWEDTDLPMCNHNVLDSLMSRKPQVYYPVDSRFNYCNTNYFLLAAIIEKVSEMSFESFMEKEIFHPLGMINTLVYSNMNVNSLHKVALGHDQRNRAMADFYLNGVTGDKGVFSTVEDLAKLYNALADTTFLSSALQKEMTKAHSKFDGKGRGYGLGWRLKTYEQDTLVYHNGWWRGYRSYFIQYPKKKQVYIILTNSVRGSFLSMQAILGLLNEDRSNNAFE